MLQEQKTLLNLNLFTVSSEDEMAFPPAFPGVGEGRREVQICEPFSCYRDTVHELCDHFSRRVPNESEVPRRQFQGRRGLLSPLHITTQGKHKQQNVRRL